MEWKLRKSKRKLSGAAVEKHFDPTHDVCLVLFLTFWSSWIPFAVDIYGYISESKAPSAYYFLLGTSQGIWKFLIIIIFCPRYRKYFSYCSINKALKKKKLKKRLCSEIVHAVIDDIALHM